MIFAWPLITSTDLAQVLRPGGRLRPDPALRSLRYKGLAAEPIAVVPRPERGAHGRAVWYSSLMVDVVRLVRAEQMKTARAAHGAATKLAAHRSARCVAEWLVEHASPDPDPNQRVPGGPHLLTVAERDRLAPQIGRAHV